MINTMVLCKLLLVSILAYNTDARRTTYYKKQSTWHTYTHTVNTQTIDSVLRAGSKTLTGSWTQENGDLSLGNRPIVFTAGSKIRGSLAKSILRDAELIDIDFKNVNFSNTDLTGSSFARSDVSGACFSGAKVTNVDFREAQGLTDRQKANLKKRGALVYPSDKPITLPKNHKNTPSQSRTSPPSGRKNHNVMHNTDLRKLNPQIEHWKQMFEKDRKRREFEEEYKNFNPLTGTFFSQDDEADEF